MINVSFKSSPYGKEANCFMLVSISLLQIFFLTRGTHMRTVYNGCYAYCPIWHLSEIRRLSFFLCTCNILDNSYTNGNLISSSCYIHEPAHDKTNKMACALSEDSDQPGHPPSLIRVFAVRMRKAWVLS